MQSDDINTANIIKKQKIEGPGSYLLKGVPKGKYRVLIKDANGHLVSTDIVDLPSDSPKKVIGKLEKINKTLNNKINQYEESSNDEETIHIKETVINENAINENAINEEAITNKETIQESPCDEKTIQEENVHTSEDAIQEGYIEENIKTFDTINENTINKNTINENTINEGEYTIPIENEKITMPDVVNTIHEEILLDENIPLSFLAKNETVSINEEEQIELAFEIKLINIIHPTLKSLGAIELELVGGKEPYQKVILETVGSNYKQIKKSGLNKPFVLNYLKAGKSYILTAYDNRNVNTTVEVSLNLLTTSITNSNTTVVNANDTNANTDVANPNVANANVTNANMTNANINVTNANRAINMSNENKMTGADSDKIVRSTTPPKKQHHQEPHWRRKEDEHARLRLISKQKSDASLNRSLHDILKSDNYALKTEQQAIKVEQIEQGQIKPEQIKSNQIKRNKIKSEDIKSEDIKSEQIKSEQIKPEPINNEQINKTDPINVISSPSKVNMPVNLPLLTFESIDSFGKLNNGKLTYTLTAGSLPVIVNLSGPLFKQHVIQTIIPYSGMFDGLVPGNYNLVAKDSNGNKEKIEFIIKENLTNLQLTFLEKKDPVCCDDGELKLEIIGGKPPYILRVKGDLDCADEIIKISGTCLIEGLNAGKYDIEIIDALQQSVAREIYLRNIESDLELSINEITHPNKENISGKITYTINGGQAPYILQTNADCTVSQLFQTSGSYQLENLNSGEHTLYLIDACKNTAKASATLNFIEKTTCPSEVTYFKESILTEWHSPKLHSPKADSSVVELDIYDQVDRSPQLQEQLLELKNLIATKKKSNNVSADLLSMLYGANSEKLTELMLRNESSEYVAGDLAIEQLVGSTISRYGANDGEILVKAKGGSPPYRYILDESLISPNGYFIKLGKDSYQLTIIDSNDDIITTIIDIAAICFSKDAYVSTDQGLIKVEYLSPDNSINGHQIDNVIFTKVKAQSQLVEIPANYFKRGVPNANTYLTPNHCVKVGNELVKAESLVKHKKGPKFVKTRKETDLYNLYLKNGSTISVNNMEVESLSHNSIIVKNTNKTPIN